MAGNNKIISFLFFILIFFLSGCSTKNKKIEYNITPSINKEYLRNLDEISRCKEYKKYFYKVRIRYAPESKLYFLKKEDLKNLLFNFKFLEECTQILNKITDEEWNKFDK